MPIKIAQFLICVSVKVVHRLVCFSLIPDLDLTLVVTCSEEILLVWIVTQMPDLGLLLHIELQDSLFLAYVPLKKSAV